MTVLHNAVGNAKLVYGRGHTVPQTASLAVALLDGPDGSD